MARSQSSNGALETMEFWSVLLPQIPGLNKSIALLYWNAETLSWTYLDLFGWGMAGMLSTFWPLLVTSNRDSVGGGEAGPWHQLIHSHVGPHFFDVKHPQAILTRLTMGSNHGIWPWVAHGWPGVAWMAGWPGSSPCIGARLPCCPPHLPCMLGKWDETPSSVMFTWQMYWTWLNHPIWGAISHSQPEQPQDTPPRFPWLSWDPSLKNQCQHSYLLGWLLANWCVMFWPHYLHSLKSLYIDTA